MLTGLDGRCYFWTAIRNTYPPTQSPRENPMATVSPPISDLVNILGERGNRYGKFTGHAEVTQMLKTIVTSGLAKRDKTLAPDQQEALDMILHKIGRIVNGDQDYADSWVDIAGYAKLVADRLEGVER